jgi:hypothetical protein
MAANDSDLHRLRLRMAAVPLRTGGSRRDTGACLFWNLLLMLARRMASPSGRWKCRPSLSPAPWVEHLDGAVRIWADGGMGKKQAGVGRAITASLEAVTGQLDSVRRDLCGFLDAVARWTQDLAPAMAGEVTAKLDQGFSITGPCRPVP